MLTVRRRKDVVAEPPMISLYEGENAFFIRVENTVFKVSDQRLCFSDLFTSMMSLPQDNSGGAEGRSVDRPVVLEQSGTAAQFKHFAWAMHARPSEITAFVRAEDSTPKCMKLLDIASLAHRFQLDEEAEWAINEVFGIIRGRTSLISGRLGARLLEVAALWGSSSRHFLTAEDMMSSALHSDAHLELIHDLVHTLDRLGSHTLLGLAYYRLLLQGERQWIRSLLTKDDYRRLQNGSFAINQIIVTAVRASSTCPSCDRQPGPQASTFSATLPSSLFPLPTSWLPDLLNYNRTSDPVSPLRGRGRADSGMCWSCGHTFDTDEQLLKAKEALAPEKLFALFDTNTALTAGMLS